MLVSPTAFSERSERTALVRLVCVRRALLVEMASSSGGSAMCYRGRASRSKIVPGLRRDRVERVRVQTERSSAEERPSVTAVGRGEANPAKIGPGLRRVRVAGERTARGLPRPTALLSRVRCCHGGGDVCCCAEGGSARGPAGPQRAPARDGDARSCRRAGAPNRPARARRAN